MRAHAGAYAQVGFTYSTSDSQAAADAGAPAAQGSGASAAAPYTPCFSIPLPERLAGALPSSARELKVRTNLICLIMPARFEFHRRWPPEWRLSMFHILV